MIDFKKICNVVVSVSLGLPVLASADVITFDDFTTDTRHTNYIPTGPNGYDGLEWFADTSTITRARWTILANEYLGGGQTAHSGDYVAHIAYGAPAFGIVFPEAVNFTGAWFLNAFGYADGITAIGYRDGKEIAQTGEITFANTFDWVNLNTPLQNVDKVEFFVQQDAYANRADVYIDDISFSASAVNIPEPASFALLLCGAGGLALARRRRR